MEMSCKQHSDKMKNTDLLRLFIYNIMAVYAMKAYQGVGVLLHALSTLTSGGHERSAFTRLLYLKEGASWCPRTVT
jgi:hypothetical protein